MESTTGRLFCALLLVSISLAEEPVLNSNECGPNYYADGLVRQHIGRLREFPWLARLGYRGRDGETEFHFQGTLIHPSYVLTSVFATGFNRNSLEMVRLGEYDTGTDKDCQEITDGEEVCAPPPQDIAIEQIIKHPQYNKPRLANDLALLKLQRPANVSSEFVRPVCIPMAKDFPLNEQAVLFISAWCGSVRSGISVVPTQYRMKQISLSSCASKLEEHIDVPLDDGSQFCAVMDLDKKTASKVKDVSLRGSTGAPVQMLGQDGRFYQVGMSSIGVRNAALETPSVFTNLVKLGEWLEQTIAAEEQNRLHARPFGKY